MYMNIYTVYPKLPCRYIKPETNNVHFILNKKIIITIMTRENKNKMEKIY